MVTLHIPQLLPFAGQVFVTSNALQQSGATIQPGSSTNANVQLQQQQQSQQTQQLVMAATGPFLQINASGKDLYGLE